uniref:Ig-like domain-containing protein n=1 Tax=Pyxicephalus adspersus TaxID=30357 RepID=A0AAV3A0F2_PYXAD|nr:TPA: hypothetical protein GDO54_013633 [Pyxicephalus adspersus]
MDCSYDGSAYAMFWYLQKPGQNLQFLLQELTKDDDLAEDLKGRGNYKHNNSSRQFPLRLNILRFSDSGTYYCALSSTLYEGNVEDVQ